MTQPEEYWKTRALKAEAELRELRENLIPALNELEKQILMLPVPPKKHENVGGRTY